MNRLIHGDCLEVLKNIEPESVDLIYLDPPFFSNRNYEIIWGDDQESRSFGDRFAGGIEHYIDWLKERVELMKGVLKKTGSIYLHCDYHANAYIKVKILDPIFGANNFRNEIIWCYSRMASKNQRFFSRSSDTIFWYAKNKDFSIFNVDDVRMPYSEKSKSREGYRKKSLGGGSPKSGICELNSKGKFPENWWSDIYTVFKRKNRLSNSKTRSTFRTHYQSFFQRK